MNAAECRVAERDIGNGGTGISCGRGNDGAFWGWADRQGG